MNDYLQLLLTGLGGLFLGGIFFGGLWWTVRRGMTSRQPVSWFLVSRLVRLGIVMTGFYYLGQGQWERLMVCLTGFIVARILVIRLTRLAGVERGNAATKETSHAP